MRFSKEISGDLTLSPSDGEKDQGRGIPYPDYAILGQRDGWLTVETELVARWNSVAVWNN